MSENFVLNMDNQKKELSNLFSVLLRKKAAYFWSLHYSGKELKGNIPML